MRTTLLDYPVDIPQPGDALAESALATSAHLHVVTLNPEMIIQGEQDPELGRILKSAGLILPDGAGVVWALKVFGHRAVRRMPGIEFAEAVLAQASRQGSRVALLGAKPEVLAATVAGLMQRYPGLNVVYSQHGYFPAEESAAHAAACAATRPDVVLVALGVPRQEKWIAQYAPLFEKAVFIGVGGSFDVWSGQVRRAPGWMRALNLEWVYRVSCEPWRLKRIAKPLPLFVVKVLLARFQALPPFVWFAQKRGAPTHHES